MATIEWDQIGDRKFQAGLDRGVLYLADKAVPWNGLTSIDETPNRESVSAYQDGIKYLDHQVLGEYAGKLTALTYPDEFAEIDGLSSTGLGVYIHDQMPKSFGLSYRTQLGDDVSGLDRGYVIHVLYNLRALPDAQSHTTLGAQAAATPFSWTLTSTPQALPGRRPTAHISIRSTDIDPNQLEYVEGLLYGTEVSEAYLPPLIELVDVIENPVIFVDNGDGTWSATGSDIGVKLINPTTFLITGADVTYLDSETFEVETTDA